MILKGRSRADGGKLADYLLSTKNEQVRVLDIRGTVTDDPTARGLKQSLRDFDELGKMTKAKSSLFHLAINPDDRDRMTPEDWQQSIDKAEKALGLEGQPRAVVSHIKDGKEHLHVVWSRVDVETRKCVHMSFSNVKLVKTAREIEIELGLQQTPQRARGAHRLNQHLKDIEQQQDGRSSDPRAERNATIQSAWQQSKDGQEFKEMIERAGYRLAIGRRGVLLVDSDNEPHSIARCVEGIKTKDVRAKLDDLEGLPTIEELRQVKTRSTDTEEEKAAKPTRQQTAQITERDAQELGLKPTADDAEPEDMTTATRRNAANMTTDQTRAAMAEQQPDNDNTEPIQRRAEQLTAAEIAASGLNRMPWENAADFAERVQWTIEHVEENPQPEPPDRSRGRSL